MFFKCKNVWVGLKARNAFASSPSSNKVYFIVVLWIAHSRVAPNTPVTNFFLFNFFPFKIFLILFFFLFNFFSFLLLNFFSYYKRKINWRDFFIFYKNWMMIFFYFRLGWIFILKHVCFCVLKKWFLFLFFSLLQINIFLIFLYYFWCDDKPKKTDPKILGLTSQSDLKQWGLALPRDPIGLRNQTQDT